MKYTFKNIFAGMALITITATQVVSSASAATITTFTDRTAFSSAAGGSVTTEDFNSFVTETPFHSSSLDVGDFTLSMAGSPSTSSNRNRIDVPPAAYDEFDVDGTNIVNVLLSFFGDALIFTFDTAITAFGADFAALNNDDPRTQIVAAGEVIAPSVTADNVIRFFGFVSDVAFTTIRFEYANLNDGFGIDNVAYASNEISAVPVPAALPLFGTGLAIMGFLGWRRKRKLA